MPRNAESLRGKHLGKRAVLLCPGPTLAKFKQDWIPSDAIVIAANIGLMQQAVPDYWVLTDWEARAMALDSLFPTRTDLVIPKGYFDEGDPRFDEPLANAYAMEVTKEARSSILGVALADLLGIDDLYIFGLDCFRAEFDYYFQKGLKPDFLTENRLLGFERIYGCVEYKAYQTKRLKELACRFNELGKSAMNIKIVNSRWSTVDNELIEKITAEQFEVEAWQKSSHEQVEKEMVEDERTEDD